MVCKWFIRTLWIHTHNFYVLMNNLSVIYVHVNKLKQLLDSIVKGIILSRVTVVTGGTTSTWN